jgi:hypothetical protein
LFGLPIEVGPKPYFATIRSRLYALALYALLDADASLLLLLFGLLLHDKKKKGRRR